MSYLRKSPDRQMGLDIVILVGIATVSAHCRKEYRWNKQLGKAHGKPLMQVKLTC